MIDRSRRATIRQFNSMGGGEMVTEVCPLFIQKSNLSWPLNRGRGGLLLAPLTPYHVTNRGNNEASGACHISIDLIRIFKYQLALSSGS